MFSPSDTEDLVRGVDRMCKNILTACIYTRKEVQLRHENYHRGIIWLPEWWGPNKKYGEVVDVVTYVYLSTTVYTLSQMFNWNLRWFDFPHRIAKLQTILNIPYVFMENSQYRNYSLSFTRITIPPTSLSSFRFCFGLGVDGTDESVEMSNSDWLVKEINNICQVTCIIRITRPKIHAIN